MRMAQQLRRLAKLRGSQTLRRLPLALLELKQQAEQYVVLLVGNPGPRDARNNGLRRLDIRVPAHGRGG